MFLGDLAGSRLKERLGDGSGHRLLLPLLTPRGAVFYDPVEERLFKADVVAGFLALDPFVAQDFFALGEELFVIVSCLCNEILIVVCDLSNDIFIFRNSFFEMSCTLSCSSCRSFFHLCFISLSVNAECSLHVIITHVFDLGQENKCYS